MDRRRFVLSSLAGVIAPLATGVIAPLATGVIAPLGAEAQAARTLPRVGFIGNADPKTQGSSVAEFVRGLRDFGFVDGKSVTLEYRWARGCRSSPRAGG
jgi:hypothetical protein